LRKISAASAQAWRLRSNPIQPLHFQAKWRINAKDSRIRAGDEFSFDEMVDAEGIELSTCRWLDGNHFEIQ
jgi:hypothetical protein